MKSMFKNQFFDIKVTLKIILLLTYLFSINRCSLKYKKNTFHDMTVLKLKYNNSYLDINQQCKNDKWGYLGSNKNNIFFFDLNGNGRIENKLSLINDDKNSSQELLCKDGHYYILQQLKDQISILKVNQNGEKIIDWKYVNPTQKRIATFINNKLVLTSLKEDNDILLESLYIDKEKLIHEEIIIENDKNISLVKTLEGKNNNILIFSNGISDHLNNIIFYSYNFKDGTVYSSNLVGYNNLKLNSIKKKENGYLIIGKEYINSEKDSKGMVLKLDENLKYKFSFSINSKNFSNKFEFFDSSIITNDNYYICGLSKNILKNPGNNLIIIPITNNKFLQNKFIYSQYINSKWKPITCDFKKDEISILSLHNNSSIILKYNQYLIQDIDNLPPPLFSKSSQFLIYKSNILKDQINNFDINSYFVNQVFDETIINHNVDLYSECFYTYSPTQQPTSSPTKNILYFFNSTNKLAELILIGVSIASAIIFLSFVICCIIFYKKCFKKGDLIYKIPIELHKRDSASTSCPTIEKGNVSITPYEEEITLETLKTSTNSSNLQEIITNANLEINPFDKKKDPIKKREDKKDKTKKLDLKFIPSTRL